MRLSILAVLAAAGLLIGSQAAAQENGGQVGLGVGVSTFSLADLETVAMPRVYVPLMAGERGMIEPSLGLLRVSGDDFTDTFLSLGSGFFLRMEPTDQGAMYAGPRVGLIRTSNADSDTHLSLAGVAGGEYFLRSHFSLGGEVGLRWFDLNDVSLLSTVSEFRVRWYFR